MAEPSKGPKEANNRLNAARNTTQCNTCIKKSTKVYVCQYDNVCKHESLKMHALLKRMCNGKYTKDF